MSNYDPYPPQHSVFGWFLVDKWLLVDSYEQRHFRKNGVFGIEDGEYWSNGDFRNGFRHSGIFCRVAEHAPKDFGNTPQGKYPVLRAFGVS